MENRQTNSQRENVQSVDLLEGLQMNEPSANADKIGVESGGEVFDPTIHAVDASGNPKRRIDGGYARRRGPKPGRKPAGAEAGGDAGDAGTADAARDNALAVTTVIMMVGVAESVLGPVWGASDVEREQMVTAWAAFYAELGIEEIPAWATLCIVMGSYALPRYLVTRRMAAVKNPDAKMEL